MSRVKEIYETGYEDIIGESWEQWTKSGNHEINWLTDDCYKGGIDINKSLSRLESMEVGDVGIFEDKDDEDDFDLD